MKKLEPFSWITEDNIKRLPHMFLLRKEEPWVIAVVADCLRPKFGKSLLSTLPAGLRSKVASEAPIARQATREQVQAIDADLRKNMDFAMGEVSRLVAMLDDADTATSDDVLHYLKNDHPSLYARVRKYMLVFDDIMGFSDREMAIIVRQLKPLLMARALQNASPKMVSKFSSNMSAGAAALLREALEYTTGITQDTIEEERAKIIELAKTFDKDGLISVLPKGEDRLVADPLGRSERLENA